MKIVTMIQARMGSTRLPGKMMLEIGGWPIIQHVISRSRLVGYETWLLTPLDDADPFESIARRNGIMWLGGSDDDVASRFIECAAISRADWILRVCGDMPFLNVDYTNALLTSTLGQDPRPDYATLRLGPSKQIAPLTRYGLVPELVWAQALERVYPQFDEIEKQHVTNHFYLHERDHCWLPELSGFIPPVSLSIDTEDDLRKARQFYQITVDLHALYLPQKRLLKHYDWSET